MAALAVAAGSFGFASPMTRLTLTGGTRSAGRMMADEDPTGNPFIQAVNSFQEALQNSPVANFKKEFAKMQAGDYDEVATKAKLDSLISDTPCVMFSFST